MKKGIVLLVLCLAGISTYANKSLQTVRGQIIDIDSKTPLIGANVIIDGTNPPIGSVTDLEGNFRLENVPVGRIDLIISYVGYNPRSLSNIIVQSGRETILNVELAEKVTTLDEVVVRSRRKSESLNKMAMVSARQFTVEETGRYAGSRNDVSRMAANFAGVTNGDDARNDIVVRGNSPTGLLWRLNGLDIPDPNHFSGVGSNGGPVSMLNYNVLSNSDFMTGAFPAEYGNAMAGAFDIKMRNGNNEQREYMFQIGSLGTELMLEGPFSKNYRGSYLINYRFSTTTLMNAMGIDFGYDGEADYQDLSYNITLPTKNSNQFTLFGLWGNSVYKLLNENKSEDSFDISPVENSNQRYITNSRVFGLNYFHRLGNSSYLNFTTGITGETESGKVDSVSTANANEIPFLKVENNYNNINLGLDYNLKINAKNKFKAGAKIKTMSYQIEQEDFNNSTSKLIQTRNSSGNTMLSQYFAQWKHTPIEQLQLLAGVQYQQLELNNTSAIEPRVGLRYTLFGKHTFNAGFGQHSQTQPLEVYFINTPVGDAFDKTNLNLEFSKSNQFIVGYQTGFFDNIMLKTEAYYQDLYNIPVHSKGQASSFSLLNEGADYLRREEDSLINQGYGKNIGLEFTLEKYFSNNYYYMVTGSLYDSKYKTNDNKWRNTAFNGNYVLNFLGGYEFNLNKNRKIMLDLKVTYAGGRHYSPVDKQASIAANETVFDNDNAFTLQHKPYFRTDFKLTYRVEMKRVSHEVFLNVDNVFNTKNIYLYGYNPMKNEFGYVYQLGLFPTFQYKIYF